MTTQVLSHPGADEYAPYYNTYIAPVAGTNALETLATQLGALDPLRSLDDARALHRYASDKWSVKETVAHITDAERIFACRMLRIARGDKTPLPGFDQQPYVDAAQFDHLPIGTLVDSFRATRAATIALTREIDADAWLRTGTASGFTVSARALAYIITGHAAHHIGILRDRYGMPV
ncbi:MAG TPA: DinB family protein [Gemmatimonadaceae bacterium]|nr:DinB family protein [Gemmatimonadaceae bacterium]